MMLSNNSEFSNHSAKHIYTKSYNTKSKTSKTITEIAPSHVKGVIHNIMHCLTKISFYEENFCLRYLHSS